MPCCVCSHGDSSSGWLNSTPKGEPQFYAVGGFFFSLEDNSTCSQGHACFGVVCLKMLKTMLKTIATFVQNL